MPTLKYYVREGLLHAGVATAVNQAEYDESHVRRVRLVRALVDLGHLSIAEVAAVVAAVDDEGVPIHVAFGLTQDSMVPARSRDDNQYRQARELVDGFVVRHDFHLRPEAQVRDMLADAFVHLAEFGLVDLADPDATGAAHIDAHVPETHRSEMVEYTVVGTVVMEVAIAAIRRMALEDASERRFGGGTHG